RVKRVGFAQSLDHHLIEVLTEQRRRLPARLFRRRRYQPQAEDLRLSAAELKLVMRRRLGSGPEWIHSVLLPIDHEVINAVLDVQTRIRFVKKPLCVRLVLREQQWNFSFAHEVTFPQFRMRGLQNTHVPWTVGFLEAWFQRPLRPGPSVPEPQGRQHVQDSGFSPPVADAELDENV